MPRQAGRHHRVERLDESVIDAACDRGPRHQVGDGLAHPELVRGRHGGVEYEVADRSAVAHVHLDALCLSQRDELSRREVRAWERHVDVAALERELHRGRLRVVADDQVLRLGRRAPVALPLLEDRLLARRVLDELIRARPVLRARVGPSLVERIGALRHDHRRSGRQVLRERRLCRDQMEDDAVLAGRRDALQVGEQRVDARGVLDLLHAVERPLHVRRGHDVAVVELHAVPEAARIGLQVALETALRCEHGVRCQAARTGLEQALEDLILDGLRPEVVARRRIDVDDAVRRAVDKSAAGGLRIDAVPGRLPGTSAERSQGDHRESEKNSAPPSRFSVHERLPMFAPGTVARIQTMILTGSSSEAGNSDR